MRAIVCTALTGIDSLTVEMRPPPSAGPGEVVVSVAAAGLNYPDLLVTTGRYQHKLEPPFVPGLEAAGTVVEVGAGVERTWLDRRVMLSARRAFAERVAVSLDDVMAIPDGWRLEAAAAFPVAAKTAFHALVHRAKLTAGETLLVHGASGGTGHIAVKMGKALGARVIATTGDPAKAPLLQAFGADAVVETNGGDLAERLKAANADRGLDVVFDPVGGAVFDASLKAAGFGARLLVIGFVADAPNVVRTNYALIKGLSVLGVRAGEAARHDPRIAASYRTDLPQIAERPGMAPRIAATFTFEDARRAFRMLEGRGAVGKIVLTPS